MKTKKTDKDINYEITRKFYIYRKIVNINLSPWYLLWNMPGFLFISWREDMKRTIIFVDANYCLREYKDTKKENK